MKKTSTVVLIVVALVYCALTTGCQHDGKAGVFTAITQDYSGAKDYIGGTGGTMIFWNDGDAVHINGGTYSVAVSDGDRHRATIVAEDAVAFNGEYYAAYPANISSIAGNGEVTFTLPQEEVYTTSGGNQVIHSVMAAKADGDNKLKFQNLCALLHFKLNGSGSGVGAKIYTIEVESDRPLWGTVTASHNGSQWVVSSVTGVDATKRTLRFDTPLTLETTAKDVYLVVPPVSGASTFTLRMVVEHSDGTVKVFEKKKDASVNFTSGNMCHFDDVITYTGSMMKFGNNEVSANTMDGSLDHPYLVYSTESWNHLASTMATVGEHISLASDINVGSTLASNFKAILDGNGHTITLTTQNISLFSVIDGGTVRNVTIAATNDVTAPVVLNENGNYYFGALTCKASNNAVFQNCHNKVNIVCDIASSRVSVGGLFGFANSSTITNCTNRGNIASNTLYVGGIAGQSTSTMAISGCVNSGNITITTANSTVKTQYCGGIAGLIGTYNSAVIADCHNGGTIVLAMPAEATSYFGGLFGQVNNDVFKCSNTGTLTCNETSNGVKYFGGIAGYYQWTQSERCISNSFNTGEINVVSGVQKMYIGGILASNRRMSIKNCYVFCDMKGSSVAGIVYDGISLFTSVTISNCYYFGTMTATNKYGIAGPSTASYKFLVDHCYYPNTDGLSMCGANSADNGHNHTLTSGLLITGNKSLCDSLNANVVNMPSGSYNWRDSTDRVVFNR